MRVNEGNHVVEYRSEIEIIQEGWVKKKISNNGLKVQNTMVLQSVIQRQANLTYINNSSKIKKPSSSY